MPNTSMNSTSTEQNSIANAHVLIAEDNLVNMEVAKFHLEDLGCTFESAINGAEALEWVKKQSFNYVLMDCQMPVMDGFEALREIRNLEKNGQNPPLKIFAVTAADDEETRALCRNAGFDGFLSKPFSTDQLNAVLLGTSTTASATQSSTTAVDASTAVASAQTKTIDPRAFAAFIADFGLDSAPSLLGSFEKLLREGTARFDVAANARDLPALQALSHKLAGAAGTIGATSLAQLAKTIEKTGKQGQLSWSPQVTELRDLIVTTHSAIQSLLDPAALQDFLKRPAAS